MKKEIDTYKLESLFSAFHSGMVWAWYLFAIVIAAALWFFPLPNTKIQVFAFATIFIVYTLLSVMLRKVAQLTQEIK